MDALYISFDYSWIYYTLMTIYAITVIVILCVIVSENRNPVKSLAWVTVLILLPLVGVVLYLFFGRSIKNTRMISRRNRRRLRRAERTALSEANERTLSPEARQQIRLAKSLESAEYYPGNDIKVYTDGASKFEALIDDLSKAKRYINLQYYIILDDEIGTRVADVLIERARAGVAVHVIYDNVGSLNTHRRYFKRMRAAGIELYPFFKVSFPPFGTRINWRNHRKICVIDGEVGYIGGMNIADRYITGGKNFDSWRDTHLRLVGPAVASLQYSFAVDWNFMGQPLLDDSVQQDDPAPGDMGVQLITSGPTAQWSNIAMMFHKSIANARHRVYIQTPYFLPTEGLLKALQTAALARVDVRIMMPRRTDSRLLQYASFSYIAECLRAGIKIYLYNPGMMHAKTLIVDDEIASVGSTNFDFRSFEHNFEANLFVYSPRFTQEMAEIFHRDMRQCTRLYQATWARRRRSLKVAESVVRLLSPIL